MVIIKQIAPLKAFLKENKRQGKTLGLVPTMGALHEGHLSLIKASKSHNDVTVCSIFVNPTQFNNPDDLLKYPRDLDKDIEWLEKVECDVLFSPENNIMYEQPSILKFDFGQLDKVMEGKYRPGHFSGVALVVSKLFNLIQPDNAYFGQKDWQQFTVVRQLVEELKFDLHLHSIATLREPDGLAMSSRNLRLSASQRQNATIFYHALKTARQALKNGTPFAHVRQNVAAIFEGQSEFTLEYFELADSLNLKLIDSVKAAVRPILCIAGFAGEVRLIDNMFVD